MFWQQIRTWIDQRRSSSPPAELDLAPVEEPATAAPTAAAAITEAAGPTEAAAPECISFWRYHAELSVFTPLRVLRRDGQKREHHPCHLQVVPNPRANHGAWIAYRPDGFMALAGLNQPQIDHLIADSGPDRELRLRFLIRFREIFESKVLHVDQKLMQIYALADKAEFAAIWPSFQVDNFPDNVFLSELTKLRGIGDQKALLLWQAGLRTPAMVQSASDRDLLSIRGIGPKLIAQLRSQTAA